jgi:hypothetical protein
MTTSMEVVPCPEMSLVLENFHLEYPTVDSSQRSHNFSSTSAQIAESPPNENSRARRRT